MSLEKHTEMGTPEEKEDKITHRISFIPDEIGRKNLFEKSEKIDLKEMDRTDPNLSVHNWKEGLKQPCPEKFCPEPLDPSKTAIVQLAKQSEIKSADFGVVNDTKMPLGSNSCGSTAVLINYGSKYGKDRINLFYKNKFRTNELLKDYIKFRNQNISKIFSKFVFHLISFDCHYRIYLNKPGNDSVLEHELQPHYSAVCNMFSKILEKHIIGGVSLSDCGIGCESFTQSWLKNGEEVGNAQFRSISPVFYNRFYIVSNEKVKKCGVTDRDLESYMKMISHFWHQMTRDFGGTNAQTYIHLEGLSKELTGSTSFFGSLKNLF